MQLPDPSTTRIAVLAGGTSNERAVSLSSGAQVCSALQRAGYAAEMIDTREVDELVRCLAGGTYDVAFIALHGKGGEDGAIQGFCEVLGIPHTGSGILASATAMDKARSKAVYREVGIPTAVSIVLYKDKPFNVTSVVDAVGEKCVVKPVDDGSSVGMSIVHAAGELPAALEKAFATSDTVLVESYITGTEITVAVLGNDNPQALPVIEIVPHTEFYDYEEKYSSAGAEHIIPARLDAEVYERAQALAVQAHQALGCRGVSRSDFIVTPEGCPTILETNTIPGMTETSLLPDAARHMGWDFPTLCATLVAYALEQ